MRKRIETKGLTGKATIKEVGDSRGMSLARKVCPVTNLRHGFGIWVRHDVMSRVDEDGIEEVGMHVDNLRHKEQLEVCGWHMGKGLSNQCSKIGFPRRLGL